MLEFNIAPNTQVGRINIEHKVYEHENTYKIEEEKYSRSGEYIENMVTDNHIEFCKRWLHLAGVEEMLDDIDEFYYNPIGKFSNLEKAFKSPIEPAISGNVCPIEFVEKGYIENPLIFYNERPSELTYNNLKENK